MYSKGFGFVAFFASEEASYICIQAKTDLAVAIVTNPELSGGQKPSTKKYCHKSEGAIIHCMSALVKATRSSFSSRWLTMTGDSRTCHRSC